MNVKADVRARMKRRSGGEMEGEDKMMRVGIE
jgi:hypothetical protein